MRAAIYARTAMASQAGIDEQIGNSRQYAELQHWVVSDAHIFRDNGVGGLKFRRPGLESLLDVATSSPRPFDLVLVGDFARLGRDESGTLGVIERLRELGIFVYAVDSGYDSREHKL